MATTCEVGVKGSTHVDHGGSPAEDIFFDFLRVVDVFFFPILSPPHFHPTVN